MYTAKLRVKIIDKSSGKIKNIEYQKPKMMRFNKYIKCHLKRMCSGSCENHIQNLCRHATTTNFREQYRGFSLRNNARLGLKPTVQCLLSMLIALDLSPSTTHI